jgi:hypothetical protein
MSDSSPDPAAATSLPPLWTLPPRKALLLLVGIACACLPGGPLVALAGMHKSTLSHLAAYFLSFSVGYVVISAMIAMGACALYGRLPRFDSMREPLFLLAVLVGATASLALGALIAA